MSRAAGLADLTAVLERELPGLRTAALALTADRAGADALLTRVVERIAAAWPRYARAADPGQDVREALVREAVRAASREPLPEPLLESLPEPLPEPPLAGGPGGVGLPGLVRVLTGMPVRERAVLVLRDLSGVPVQRAAAVLGVPVAQAVALHRRAVRSLGGALGEVLEEPAGPLEGAEDATGTGGSTGAEDVVVVDLSDPDGRP